MNCLFNAPGAVHKKQNKKQVKNKPKRLLDHMLSKEGSGQNTQSVLFNFFESSRTKCLKCQ